MKQIMIALIAGTSFGANVALSGMADPRREAHCGRSFQPARHRHWRAWNPSSTALRMAGVKPHLSEVKGPVMDRLRRSCFLEHLTGNIYLSQSQAFEALLAVAAREDDAPAVADPWLARGLL